MYDFDECYYDPKTDDPMPKWLKVVIGICLAVMGWLLFNAFK